MSCKGPRSGSCDSRRDRVPRFARTAGGPAARGVGHWLGAIRPLVKSGSDPKGGQCSPLPNRGRVKTRLHPCPIEPDSRISQCSRLLKMTTAEPAVSHLTAGFETRGRSAARKKDYKEVGAS